MVWYDMVRTAAAAGLHALALVSTDEHRDLGVTTCIYVREMPDERNKDMRGRSMQWSGAESEVE
jgi:hypothetical protein